MIPNMMNANPPGRKASKRGRKPLFDATIFKERFPTIERVFGWEDKFVACCFGLSASASCIMPSKCWRIR
jgi:hypothetical protein